MARDQLLGRYGGLLSSLVHLRAFVAPSFPAGLQASALLALTQLMAVDARFCNDNIALLFTLLYKRCVREGGREGPDTTGAAGRGMACSWQHHRHQSEMLR